jgi:regulator of sirC expression with transglutaminase-like and TPR domain
MFHSLSAFDHLSSLSSETFDCEGERLEEYAIAVSRMYYNCEGPTDTTSQWIRNRLDVIAETVLGRYPSQGGLSPGRKLEIIAHVLSQEMHFTGNDDYYDYQNSLLLSALQRKRSIPLTLAIITNVLEGDLVFIYLCL